jgi:MFS family permease
MRDGLPSRWLILAILFFARTTMGIQFQSVGAIAPILHDELGLDYAAIGTLIGLYMLPGVFVAMPAGVIGGMFGARRVVIGGLAAMIAGGLLMAATSHVMALAAGRLLSGAGAVLMNVMLTKMVVDWFTGRELSTAMAISIASWPLGIALALLGFVPLAHTFGWSAVMVAASAACLVALAGIVVCYREPPGAAATVPRLALNLGGREWLSVSCAGTVWGTYNVGYIVLVSFLSAYFETLGWPLASANALVSWLGWSLIVFVPLGGYLADRTDRPLWVIGGAFTVVAAASAVLAGNIATLWSFALIAVVIGLPAGPIVALPAASLAAANRSAGMGLFFSWYYVLMAGLPPVAGYIRDLTRTPATPPLFAGAMMVAALAALLAFRWSVRRTA